jgi:hypothetical protein
MDRSALVVPIGGDAGYVAEGVEDAAWVGDEGYRERVGRTMKAGEAGVAGVAGKLRKVGTGGKDRSRVEKRKKKKKKKKRKRIRTRKNKDRTQSNEDGPSRREAGGVIRVCHKAKNSPTTQIAPKAAATLGLYNPV